jgi:hypothetical protein
MGTQKGKLFELARMYRTYQKNGKVQPEKKSSKKKETPIKASGQHFDEGKAITLTYNIDMYPEELNESHRRQAESFSLWDNDHSEAFYVEPFDMEETVEVPYRDVTDESEDAQLDKIVKGFSANTNEEDEHEDLSDDEEKLGDMSKKIDDMLKSDDGDESGAMSDEVLDDNVGEEVPAKMGSESVTEPVEVQAETVTSGEQSLSYDASDEEFARDIGAILTGQKLYDSEQKKTIGKGSANSPSSNSSKPQVPAKSAGGGDDMLDPNKNEHKIFEKIAQSMTYANSYDLGAIALEEKFELMDREIEKQEIKAVLSTPPEKLSVDEIQDADVIDDGKKPDVAMGLSDEKYNPPIPLDNTNGGRLVKVNQLQKGDLVLAGTTSDSIAGVYSGGNKVLTKGENGAFVGQSLDDLMSAKAVVAVLRHEGADSEKGELIADALEKLNVEPLKTQPAPWIRISIPMVRPHADVCREAGTDKEKCQNYNSKINLGTTSNDSFQCTESIMGAFEKQKIPFAALMSKEHNGSLRYFGHLKNKA